MNTWSLYDLTVGSVNRPLGVMKHILNPFKKTISTLFGAQNKGLQRM